MGGEGRCSVRFWTAAVNILEELHGKRLCGDTISELTDLLGKAEKVYQEMPKEEE